MKPRISTSRKWSPLPPELVTQIRSVFGQSFQANIGDGLIEVGGQIYPEEILISVGFRKGNSLRQSNFVVSMAYARNKDNVLKLLHLGVDALASLFEQFFASENDHDFPRLWEEVNFEGRKIYVQYDTVNSALESEADRLLGESGLDPETLAQGAWGDEEIQPEHVKAHLGLTEEEADSPIPPKKKPGHKPH